MKTKANLKTKGFGRKTRRRGGTPKSPNMPPKPPSKSPPKPPSILLPNMPPKPPSKSPPKPPPILLPNPPPKSPSKPPSKRSKPSVLKSTRHMVQYNGDCALHSLARSLSRTFQVLTIIDGDYVMKFYTLIYLMMIKLFKLTCDIGVDYKNLHSYINTILKKLYEYSKDDPSSDLDNYKYSDIPCNFLENKVCENNDTKILGDVPQTEIDKFKERFRKIYESGESKAFQVKQYIYEIDAENPNYPTSGIVKLLEKKLQPYFVAQCINHAMVLTSWGMNYDNKDLNGNIIPTDADDHIFGYTNTWVTEYKNNSGDLRELCKKIVRVKNQSRMMYFICLDYDETLIKSLDFKDEIMDRREQFFKTVKHGIKIKKDDDKNNEFKSDVYEGEWKNGKSHGTGTMTYENGDVYKGDWDNGINRGTGTMKYKNGDVYEGEWNINGIKKGTMKYKNGDVYEGEWTDGVNNGQGTMKYKNGDVYEGEWTDGVNNGQGTMKYKNGDLHEGNWYNGKQYGKGKMKYANGDFYEGEWTDGVKKGKGIMKYANGDFYEGQWYNGKEHGKGIMKYKNGDVYEGQWKYGNKLV
jgi:hypothetical protein